MRENTGADGPLPTSTAPGRVVVGAAVVVGGVVVVGGSVLGGTVGAAVVGALTLTGRTAAARSLPDDPDSPYAATAPATTNVTTAAAIHPRASDGLGPSRRACGFTGPGVPPRSRRHA